MTSRSLTIEQILALLTEAQPRIATLVTGLASAQLHTSTQPGAWSVNDVLAHLRSCADVWGDCIVAILAEDTPTLVAVNPTTWINKTDYLELDFFRSFRSFAAQRAELLAVLEPLPPDSWSRAASVTGAGKVLERTVLSYAQRLAGHERQHVRQIERIIRSMGLASSSAGAVL